MQVNITLEEKVLLGAQKVFLNDSKNEPLNIDSSNQIESPYKVLALFRRLEWDGAVKTHDSIAKVSTNIPTLFWDAKKIIIIFDG